MLRFFEPQGLVQVFGKPHRSTARLIQRLSEPAERDLAHLPVFRTSLHQCREFVSSYSRQADIEDGEVKLHLLKELERGFGVIGDGDGVAVGAQRLALGFSGIDVVVNDHDVLRPGHRRSGRDLERRGLRRGLRRA